MYLDRGHCNSVFSKILLVVISRLVANGTEKKITSKREETLEQFVCTYLARGRCNSVFSKILLIVMPRLLLYGIAQNYLWNIRVARDDIDIISVIIPH